MRKEDARCRVLETSEPRLVGVGLGFGTSFHDNITYEANNLFNVFQNGFPIRSLPCFLDLAMKEYPGGLLLEGGIIDHVLPL